MRADSRMYFATVTPDGKYRPFNGAVKMPEADGSATLFIDSSHGLSGSCVTICDELIVSMADYRWLKCYLGMRPVWELRKRGKVSHKNRRKRHG